MRTAAAFLIVVSLAGTALRAQDVARSAAVRANTSLGRGVWLRHCAIDANRRLVVARLGDREAGCVIAAQDVLDARRIGDDAIVLACVDGAGGGSLVRLRLNDDDIEPVAEVGLGARRPALVAVGRGCMVFLGEDRVLWQAPMPAVGLPAPDAWQVLAGSDRIGERADRFGTAGLGITPAGTVVLRLDMAQKLEFPLPDAASAPAAEPPSEGRRLQFAEGKRSGAVWSVPGVRVHALQAPATVREGGAGVPAWSQVRVGDGARFARVDVVALVSWSPRAEPQVVAIGGHEWLLPLRMVRGEATASVSPTQLDLATLVPTPRGAAAVGGFVYVQFAVFDADGALLGATDVRSIRIAASTTAR